MYPSHQLILTLTLSTAFPVCPLQSSITNSLQEGTASQVCCVVRHLFFLSAVSGLSPSLLQMRLWKQWRYSRSTRGMRHPSTLPKEASLLSRAPDRLQGVLLGPIFRTSQLISDVPVLSLCCSVSPFCCDTSLCSCDSRRVRFVPEICVSFSQRAKPLLLDGLRCGLYLILGKVCDPPSATAAQPFSGHSGSVCVA